VQVDDSRRQGAPRLALYGTPVVALAALAVLLYFVVGRGEPAQLSGSAQVAGSETMRPVVTACAEDFMGRNPQADVVVRGGGSGDGIAALLHGMVDIGMTSRPLSRREQDYAASKGIELSVSDLALDGIAIIVNRANAITALGIGELQKIFTGKIRNWRELDGAELEIAAFARAAGSGTASLFGERVLGEETYSGSIMPLPTNEAIVAEVAARPGAIGYTGLGALRTAGDRVKLIALRTDAQPTPVAPTAEAIRSGHYPLTRTLYLGTAGNPSDTARAFIDFCLSPSGQALLQRAGYVGIKSAQ
jgi:phosphate transport system substrate-binding protein